MNKLDSKIPWIGKVPIHWTPMRLRDCVEGCINGIWGDEPSGDEKDIDVIRVADFDRTNRKTLPAKTIRSVAKGQREGRTLESGDLLIEKSGGGDLQPVGMVVEYIGENLAVSSNFVARMEPRKGVSGRYLIYLHAHFYENRITTLSIKQSTGIQNLDSNSYLSERCYLPPLDEQKAIAAYLDTETRRIDALIEEKNKLSEHLSELRKRAIYEAVFVDQIGWRRSRLKFLSERIIDTEHKTCPYYDDGKFMVVRTTNIKSGRLVFDDAKYTNEEGFRDWTQRAVPQPDDILLTREAPAGEACLVPFDVPLCVGQRTVLIKVDRRIAHPEFVLWSLYGGLSAQFIADLSRGSTVPHFNMGDIGDIPLCIGPLSEQIARTELLKNQLTQIDDLAGHVIKEVKKLRELRQATITDAVLGRIDVRDFAPH